MLKRFVRDDRHQAVVARRSHEGEFATATGAEMIKSWFQSRVDCAAHPCNESGQALIETAIASSMLVLLLLGAVELGRMAYAAIEVSNAARAAAQYGAMNGGALLSTDPTGLDAAGMLSAAQADAGNLGSLVQWNGNPTYTCACTGTETPSCTPPAIPSGCTKSHLIMTVNVKVKANFDPLIYLPTFGHSSIMLYGSAQEEVLQ